MKAPTTPMGPGRIGELQEWMMFCLKIHLVEPLPPWWPTWCLLTPQGGVIPTNSRILSDQLAKIKREK